MKLFPRSTPDSTRILGPVSVGSTMMLPVVPSRSTRVIEFTKALVFSCIVFRAEDLLDIVSLSLQDRGMSGSVEDFSQFDLSGEEKDRLVAEVVRYVLFKTHQSSGCPIKREELTQIVTKNYRHRALPAAVINEAKEKLASVFGYDLKELQRSRPSTKNQTRSSQQSAADTKSYVIISQLPADVYRKYVEDIITAHLTGFTFVIISIVHLAGGKISEENLSHHLRRMGLQETDESHPALGNVKLSLESLVQQRYLQKDKVNGPEGNIVTYELAERALDSEVSLKIRDYISQIVNKDLGTVEVD